MKLNIASLLFISFIFVSCSSHKTYGKLKIEIATTPNNFPFNMFDTIRIISDSGNVNYNKAIGISSVICDSIGFGSINLDSLPYGSYKIEYRDNFSKRISNPLIIEKHITHKYIDLFAVDEHSKENYFIDKLTPNDTLLVLSKRIFCTSGPINYYPIILFKKNNQIFYTIDGTTNRMNKRQYSYFRKFEQIIRKLGESKIRATTYDEYQIIFKRDTVKFIDGSSKWNGYYSLYKELMK